MSEVKRFVARVGGMDGVMPVNEHYTGRDRQYVYANDFDAAQAELSALREESRLLRHSNASFLETVAKVCDMIGLDVSASKNAEGKPSDVLFAHVKALREELASANSRLHDVATLCATVEQCLAAAEQRNADDLRDAERYRSLRTVTPYRFKKMQDASVTDGGDVLYFHADRFDALMDAELAKPTESGASE